MSLVKDFVTQTNDSSFESCIKCTVCTTYCPVSKVNERYPGPKQAGPDGERLRLKNAAFYDDALSLCLNCKRCEVACPSEVDIGDIIQRARLNYSQKKPSLRDALLAHTDFMGQMATPFAPIVNLATGMTVVKKVMDKTLKIDCRRQFPKYAFGTFRKWYRKQAEKQQQFAEQITMFHGCYINYNNPPLGKDIVKVFNAMNVGVSLLEKERCCGAALIANGFVKGAKKNAQVNIDGLQQAIVTKKQMVISESSTCVLTLKEEYSRILGLDTEHLHDHIETATRQVYRLLMEGKTLPLKPLRMRVAYHTPCHMEKLGWENYSIALLKMVPELDVVVLESQCCGIAGTYGFKKENYETAQNIGAPVFRQIEESRVDLVVSDCQTCKWQLEMSTSKKCEHPLTILAMALDG